MAYITSNLYVLFDSCHTFCLSKKKCEVFETCKTTELFSVQKKFEWIFHSLYVATYSIVISMTSWLSIMKSKALSRFALQKYIETAWMLIIMKVTSTACRH